MFSSLLLFFISQSFCIEMKRVLIEFQLQDFLIFIQQQQQQEGIFLPLWHMKLEKRNWEHR